MEFCDCGGLMKPEKKVKHTVLVCRVCDKESRRKINKKDYSVTHKKKQKEDDVVVITKDDDQALPKAQAVCSKCDNEEAFWWSQQTRAADEPQTRFFKCTECGHTWREYE